MSQAEARSPTAEPCLPPPPIPSNDPKLLQVARVVGPVAGPIEVAQVGCGLTGDVFSVTAAQALELLGANIEWLVATTGDVPPTPPPRSPILPNMRDMEEEKRSLVHSASEKNLARIRSGSAASSPRLQTPRKNSLVSHRPSTPLRGSVDGVQLRPTQPSTPPPPQKLADPSTPSEPYVVIGANSQPLNEQHNAITRKFYSKQPPPISIADYLRRLHLYCPMSTAVYLATSLYIYRLAVTEGAIAVTARNAHRLLLAGLRVAMKALEDVCFPHEKMARVGGVSQTELARLEINFCFLTGFELVVTVDALREHWQLLREAQEEACAS